MGGGGLRILGHKKWHVWRRENLERVERDEREHEEKSRSLRGEQTRREQEQRAQLLGQTPAGDAETREHINFFQQEEEAHTKALLEGGDDGRKKTKARANETLGRQAQLPWYAQSSEKGGRDQRVEGDEDSRKDRKRKRALEQQDPLLGMRPSRAPDDEEDQQLEDERVRRRLAKRQREKEATTSHDRAAKRLSYESDSNSDSDARRRRRHARKKHKKSMHKDDSGSREQLLTQLRREREEREAVERERTERLMRGH